MKMVMMSLKEVIVASVFYLCWIAKLRRDDND